MKNMALLSGGLIYSVHACLSVYISKKCITTQQTSTGYLSTQTGKSLD